MKKAIDISMDFTAALVEAQRETLANLDDLAQCISTEQLRHASRMTEIRNELLAIRAKVADGSDDGARLIAEALAPRVEIREAAE